MMKLILVSAFLALFFFVSGLYCWRTAGQKRIARRMQELGRKGPELLNTYKAPGERKASLRQVLGRMGSIFTARSYTGKVQQELEKAEIHLRGEEFLALCVLLVLGASGLGYFLGGGIAGTLLLAALALVLPWLLLRRRKKQRFVVLERQIGEALNVMTNALRSGYSFQQAMALAGKEMEGPLPQEFRKTLREINLGTPTDQALLNLTGRVESDDLELMTQAILIQRQTGGNLAQILDNISDTIRERLRIKGEIKTLTAQGRISAIVITLLPPALFLVIMLINPCYIMVLMGEPLGWMMMGGAVVSELIGVLLITRIVDIEV